MAQFESRRIAAAIALLFLCVAPITMSLLIRSKLEPGPLRIGEKVPAFRMTALDGRVFTPDGSENKKILLLFFTSACVHCRREMANLEELWRKRIGRIEIVGVSLDGPRVTQALQGEMNLNMPLVVADAAELQQAIRLTVVPAMFCIDEVRILRHYYAGEHTLSFDARVVAEFAAEPPPNSIGR